MVSEAEVAVISSDSEMDIAEVLKCGSGPDTVGLRILDVWPTDAGPQHILLEQTLEASGNEENSINGSDVDSLDDEIDELMNEVVPPLESPTERPRKTWGELKDGIDKILKMQKTKVTLTLSQVSDVSY